MTTLVIPDEAAQERCGARLYAQLPQAALVTLSGPLGAGKTTLVRGMLRAASYQGPVKSPTFTLVEAYELPTRRIFHFDLYRLDPSLEMLDDLGFRDYLTSDALVVVEWPERAADEIPAPTLAITLAYHESGRQLTWTSALPITLP